MGQSTYKILVEADVSKLVSEVQKGLQQIEKRGGDLDLFNNPDFTAMLSEFKKVLAKMKAEAESLKLGKIDTATVDTKPIDDLLKKFKNINKEIDTLNGKLDKLGAGANFDGLANKFSSIKSDLEAINTLLNNGGFVKQTKTTTSAASGVSKELAHTIQLYKQLKEAMDFIDGKSNDSDKIVNVQNLEEASAAAQVASERFDNLADKAEQTEIAFRNAQKAGNTDEARRLLEERIRLYSELTQVVKEYQAILNTIDNNLDIDNEQWNNLSIDAEIMEEFMAKRKKNIAQMKKVYSEKIPAKYFTDDGIDESLLGGATSTTTSGKMSIPIDVVVTTQSSTILKRINELLTAVQAKVATNPIEVPVKVASMAVKGDGVKNKKTPLEEGIPSQITTVIKAQVDTDIAATKRVIESNVQEIENILKSAKLALPDITVPENFSAVIKELREYQKAQAVLSQVKKSAKSSTTTKPKEPAKPSAPTTPSTASTTPPKIDISSYTTEIKSAISALTVEISKNLKGGLDNSVKAQFAEMAKSISDSFSNASTDVVAEINKIVTALERLQQTLRVAFDFDTDAQLNGQWNNIVNQFNAIADASGKVDMRKKGVQDLLSSMQAYQSKGGTKTFTDLTDNIDTINKLYAKQEQLNASAKKNEQNVQTAQYQAETQAIVNLTEAMTNAANAIQAFAQSNTILLKSSEATIARITTLVEKVEALNKAMATQPTSAPMADNVEQQAKAAEKSIELNKRFITSSVSNFDEELNKAFSQGGKTNAFITQLGEIQSKYNALKTTLTDGTIDFGNAEQVGEFAAAIKKLGIELSDVLLNKRYNIRQGKGTVLDNILFSDPTNDFETYKREVLDYASSLGTIIDKTISTDNLGNVSVQVRDINGQIQRLKFEWDDLNNTVKMTQITSGAAMSGVQQFVSSFKDIFNTFKKYFSGDRLINKAWEHTKKGFEFVRSLDASLTTMSMTMDTTDSAMERMGRSSIDMAKKLGSTVDSVTSVGEIYANMNESVESILAKGEPTVALSNATGLDVSTAADIVQGVVNQYKELEGQESYIVSSLEKVSAEMKMNFGDGVEYMSQALQKSGSVAKEAGMAYETFIATAGKISEITRQSGDVTGNAMKTIVARLGRITDPDEEALSASEVSDIAKAYKSVGINVYNANGEFQDIEVTMSSLAEKWDTLTDAERSYVAEKSAGTRQKNTFMVWMNEYKEIEKLAQAAAESDGFMDEVQSKHEKSLTAKINTLKATGQETWNNILGGPEAENVIKNLTLVLELLNLITEQAGLIPTIFAGITMKGLTKSGGRIKMLILNMVYATEAFNGNMCELS